MTCVFDEKVASGVPYNKRAANIESKVGGHLDGCAVVSMAGIELSHGHCVRSARAPTSLSHEWMMQLMFTILHDAICTTRADRPTDRPTSTAIPRSPRRRDGTIPTIPVSRTSNCGTWECWRDRGESTTGKYFQPTTTSRRRSTLSPRQTTPRQSENVKRHVGT
jgi:hypothetical protein